MMGFTKPPEVNMVQAFGRLKIAGLVFWHFVVPGLTHSEHRAMIGFTIL